MGKIFEEYNLEPLKTVIAQLENISGIVFWSQFQIKDQDASFRWETYDKLDRDGNTVSTLLDPRTENFKKLKTMIEEKVIILSFAAFTTIIPV